MAGGQSPFVPAPGLGGVLDKARPAASMEIADEPVAAVVAGGAGPFIAIPGPGPIPLGVAQLPEQTETAPADPQTKGDELFIARPSRRPVLGLMLADGRRPPGAASALAGWE